MVEGVDSARRTWTLTARARQAFSPPKKAEDKFASLLLARDNSKCDLQVALLFSKHYALPYQRQRELVLQHLNQWAHSVANRPEIYRPKGG